MLAEFEADCVSGNDAVEQRPASAKLPVLLEAKKRSVELDEAESLHVRNHSAEQRSASAKRPILAPLDEAESEHSPVVQRPAAGARTSGSSKSVADFANPQSLSRRRVQTGKRLRRSRMQHVEEVSPHYLACGMFSSDFVAGRQMVSGELSK